MVCSLDKCAVCEEAPRTQIIDVLVALAGDEDVIVSERVQHLLVIATTMFIVCSCLLWFRIVFS